MIKGQAEFINKMSPIITGGKTRKHASIWRFDAPGSRARPVSGPLKSRRSPPVMGHLFFGPPAILGAGSRHFYTGRPGRLILIPAPGVSFLSRRQEGVLPMQDENIGPGSSRLHEPRPSSQDKRGFV